MSMKIDVKKFSILKGELKKFRKTIFGKKDKMDICKRLNVTTDEINLVIKYLAYEKMKESKNSN